MIRNLIVTAFTAFAITACSSSVDERISDYILDGEYDDALEWVTDELKDDPENSYLNFMAMRVTLAKCAAENCFDNAPENLNPVLSYATKVTQFSVQDDDGLVDLYAKFSNILVELSNSKHHPIGLVTLLKNLPEHEFKTLTMSVMASKGLEHVEQGNIPATAKIFGALGEYTQKDDPNKYVSKLIFGYVTNDADVVKDALASAPSSAEELPVSQVYLKAFPYAVYQKFAEENAKEATVNFLQEFRGMLESVNIPYLKTNEGRAEVANAVYAITRSPAFVKKAALAFVADKADEKVGTPAVEEPVEKTLEAVDSNVLATPEADVSSTEILETNVPDADVKDELAIDETAKEELRLRVLKLALLINPRSEKSWENFLTPAAEFAMQVDKPSLLFDGLNPQDIPTSVIENYNENLFKLFEHNIANNRSILGLVSHVILPADGGNVVKSKVANLLNEAMIKAVDDENYDLVYEYASFQPDVAKLSRQKIVSITLDALEKKWNKSEFSGMNVLAQFLSKTMGIDFSLDSFLLQSFDDHLSKIGVQKKLDAETVDNLLKEEAEARIDLGEKFAFLQTQFKDQPDVLDNMLKNLIVKADGVYGVPNALYMLNGYFSESFPEAERKSYLEGSIRNSLESDDTLTVAKFAETGTALHEKFPGVSMLFVVNEALNRAVSLEEVRELWNNAPAPFIASMKETKPQYVTLMRAIEAYENGDHQSAASMFTVLSDPELIQIARPYLSEYIETVNQHAGVYATSSGEGDGSMNTQFIRIELATSSLEKEEGKDTVTADTDLLAVNLSFVNALGTIKREEKSVLSENYGTVVSFKTKGRINPNTMEIVIEEQDRTGAGLVGSFEKTFGKLKTLSLDKDNLHFITEDGVYDFEKVSNNPEKVFFPNGKFAMTKVISETAKGEQFILPKGAILELYTDESRKILRGEKGKENSYYLVKGSLKHPASSKAENVKGVYNPKTAVAELIYKYPFPSGGTLEAQVRCQVVGTYILCAGHNKHWERQKYSYSVSGRQIRPAVTAVQTPTVLNSEADAAYQSNGVRNR